MKNSIILASASPRRRELIKLLPYSFEFFAPKTNEILPEDISPEAAVCFLAKLKAQAKTLQEGEIVIGCDTLVVKGNDILGKPKTHHEAAAMLRLLSGSSHRVLTGVCIHTAGAQQSFYEETQVFFRSLEEKEIADYVISGEPMDKAGAYGIQGKGALFIKGIKGDYFNVVGLPVCRLNEALKAFIAQHTNL